MAIEVLKRGVTEDEKVYEAVCFSCKSHLRFKRSDAEYVSDQRDGDYLKINCPVCRGMVTEQASSGRVPTPSAE